MSTFWTIKKPLLKSISKSLKFFFFFFIYISTYI
nr:MAG TPA: hypothetical protein [Caudoviricetes sp.]